MVGPGLLVVGESLDLEIMLQIGWKMEYEILQLKLSWYPTYISTRHLDRVHENSCIETSAALRCYFSNPVGVRFA